MGFASKRNSNSASLGPSEGRAYVRSEQPDSAFTREQLERVLGSTEFLGSERTRRFLRYVVEETLAGRGERIKAFTVAVAAFDRDETFNPQSDPIVRIEAARLRRSLERYYLVAGAKDSVRIEIPKGSYVPLFSWLGKGHGQETPGPAAPAEGARPERRLDVCRALRPTGSMAWLLAGLLVAALAGGLGLHVAGRGQEAESPLVQSRPLLPRPALAVLSFEAIGQDRSDAVLAAGMTNEIVRELWRHSGVYVLSPGSLRRFGPIPDVMVVGGQTGVDFVLAGDVHRAGDRVRVAVRLNETKAGGVIWAETFDRDLDVGGIFDLQAEIGREIVRKIARSQGAIAHFDWKRTKGMAPETWEAYDCVVQAEELRRSGGSIVQTPAIGACLQRAVKQEPGYAEPWIVLALSELDAVRYNPQTEMSAESFAEALAAAERGIELAPESGRAHMAMMLALFFRGEAERALAAGDLALRLSPQDPDVIGEVGLRQVVSGDADDGVELLERATSLYEAMPLGHRLALSLGYLRKGLYTKASDTIAEFTTSPNYVYWSVAAAVHGKADRIGPARVALKELLRLNPDFPSSAWQEVRQRRLAPDLAELILEGWQAAGLAIEAPPGKNSNP